MDFATTNFRHVRVIEGTPARNVSRCVGIGIGGKPARLAREFVTCGPVLLADAAARFAGARCVDNSKQLLYSPNTMLTDTKSKWKEFGSRARGIPKRYSSEQLQKKRLAMIARNKLPQAGKPLVETEVPENLRTAFVFKSQRIEPVKGRTYPVMVIERKCLDCEKKTTAKVAVVRQSIRLGTLSGICQPCARKRPHPQPQGSASVKWKGGRIINGHGYVMLKTPAHPRAQNGYVHEHRLVMEKHLGRFLLTMETVHHKNGIKTDNRIENLELWGKAHSSGQRYDDLSIAELDALITHLQDLLKRKNAHAN